MNTYFVIETLDFLKKKWPSDRFNGFYRVGAEYQAGYGRGQRYDHRFDQARGMTRALDRMAEIACKEGGDTASKRLVIAHCNNRNVLST